MNISEAFEGENSSLRKAFDQAIDTPDTEWEKEFIATWYCYNLKTGSPAGAEKEAVRFIKNLLTKEREERDTYWKERVQLCDGYLKIGNTIYKPTEGGWDVTTTEE